MKSDFKPFAINGRIIHNNLRPYIVMEIGCNYENDPNKAREMIIAAAKAGADAVKFQTVIPEKLVTRDAPKFWDIAGCPGETQYDEFKLNYYLSPSEYREMMTIAVDNGIHIFSSPEDEESLELLVSLGMPALKISSMNLTHFPLLKVAAQSSKPIVLSTGMATIDEIREAVDYVYENGAQQVALLHCITNYPTRNEDANLLMMVDLMRKFPDLPVGYSDHTVSDPCLTIPLMATLLGAAIIEKHFTFDRSRPGYDHEISFDYADLERFTKSISIMEKAKGDSTKHPIPNEEKIKINARRSLVFNRDLKAGTIIKREWLDVKRPGTGIPSRDLELILGRRLKQDIKEDTVLQWEMIEISVQNK